LCFPNYLSATRTLTTKNTSEVVHLFGNVLGIHGILAAIAVQFLLTTNPQLHNLAWLSTTFIGISVPPEVREFVETLLNQERNCHWNSMLMKKSVIILVVPHLHVTVFRILHFIEQVLCSEQSRRKKEATITEYINGTILKRITVYLRSLTDN